MLAGEREALLRVVDELCAELGYPDPRGDVPGARSPLQGEAGLGQALSAEDESLVARLRRGLAKVAAAISAANPGKAPAWGAGAALDGVEMVMRGELVSGNARQLPSLVPAFVFLVALSITEQDAALELSQRTSELIEGALGA
jgi:hypothetical protein